MLSRCHQNRRNDIYYDLSCYQLTYSISLFLCSSVIINLFIIHWLLFQNNTFEEESCCSHLHCFFFGHFHVFVGNNGCVNSNFLNVTPNEFRPSIFSISGPSPTSVERIESDKSCLCKCFIFFPTFSLCWISMTRIHWSNRLLKTLIFLFFYGFSSFTSGFSSLTSLLLRNSMSKPYIFNYAT